MRKIGNSIKIMDFNIPYLANDRITRQMYKISKDRLKSKTLSTTFNSLLHVEYCMEQLENMHFLQLYITNPSRWNTDRAIKPTSIYLKGLKSHRFE